MNTCKTCQHWRNKQRELSFKESSGFCDHWDSDNENANPKVFVHNPYEVFAAGFLNDDGTVHDWQSELVTGPDFGCIHHSALSEGEQT